MNERTWVLMRLCDHTKSSHSNADPIAIILSRCTPHFENREYIAIFMQS